MICLPARTLWAIFYQPKLVLIDTTLLKTLPVRFLHDGLAEAIKYGCIRDRALFEKITAMRDDDELWKTSAALWNAAAR